MRDTVSDCYMLLFDKYLYFINLFRKLILAGYIKVKMISYSPVLLVIVIVISALAAIGLLSSHIVQINTSDHLWYWLCSDNESIQNNLVFKLMQRNIP